MGNKLTLKEVLVIVAIFGSMIGTLIYGFYLVREEQEKNCWNKYTTEYDAITNCEGVNK